MSAVAPAVRNRAPHASGVTRLQLLAFVVALIVAGTFLAAGTMMVPIKAALLPSAFRGRYMDLGVAAAGIVVTVASVYVFLVRRFGKRLAAHDVVEATPSLARSSTPVTRWFSPLAVLQPEVMPLRVIAVTALVALAMVAGAWVMVLPPWAVVTAALIPWLPTLFVEGVRKYRHYGLYAVFGAITLLQIGHLGEHAVQVAQVFLYDGDLSRAHGVFGQLDFETVHFVWDSIVWIGLGVLVVRFGAGNPWLWVSLFAASLHEIEHIYLFSIYRMDATYYSDGGFEGIMGFGGLIGSPLGRPYLHFAYNVCVIVPLVMAFWVQTKRVHRNGREGEIRTRDLTVPNRAL